MLGKLINDSIYIFNCDMRKSVKYNTQNSSPQWIREVFLMC